MAHTMQDPSHKTKVLFAGLLQEDICEGLLDWKLNLLRLWTFLPIPGNICDRMCL